ncbi:MAG: hypothetical protein KAI74_03685 [Kiritimatiellae bacterium]|nr:hypothetical protein [Kiritimatiellia bacterium]
MGITYKKDIICKIQDEFHAIDKAVTGFAFDMHNDIGNFCNEQVYQEILKQKCLENSMTANSEVEITLTYIDRYNYSVDFSEWLTTTEKCSELKSIFIALLEEWGAFLDYNVYNEAITHFLSNGQSIIRPVDVYFNGQIAGKQKMHLLNNTTAFHLSAITRKFASYDNNIKRLIRHTNIDTVQWINLNHHNIKFKTINKHYPSRK